MIRRILYAIVALILAAVASAGLITIAGSRGAPGALTVDQDYQNFTSGASMRTRFDTEGEVEDYQLLNSQHAGVTWDETRSWGGVGSMRMAIDNGDAETSGDWFRHIDDAYGLFTGTGGQTGTPSGTDQGVDPPAVIEYAFAVYVPTELRDTLFPGGGGWKLANFGHDAQANTDFEIVWQNTNQRGYPQGYYRNPPNTQPWEESITSTCSPASPDIIHQTEIDHGANALTNLAAVNPDDMSAWTDCEKSWARWGGTFGRALNSYPDSLGTGRVWKFWEQLDPTGANIGPVLFPSDGCIALRVNVELNSYSAATNVITWYAQRPFHSDWVLLHTDEAALLPTSNISEYGGESGSYDLRFNTLHLTIFHTGRTSGGGVSTFINYLWAAARIDGSSFPAVQAWPSFCEA